MFAYPLSDKIGFVLLAIFVGVFSVAASFAAFGAGFAVLFSQGLLYAYAFSAINRVSAGDLRSFMPNIGDISDLAEPLRGGVAALLISSGPLVALAFLHPPDTVLAALGGERGAAFVAPRATPTPEPTVAPQMAALLEENPGDADGGDESERAGEDEGGREPHTVVTEEPAVPAWAFGAYVLALLWKVVYSPIALVAAAISRSFVATLNPLTGLDAIRRMGSTYWTAMGVYTAIAIGETLIEGGLGLIPFAGGFLRAFVQSYAYLAIGCLLGVAVFKKAPELGLD